MQLSASDWRLYLTAVLTAGAAAVAIYLVADHFEVTVKVLTRDPYRAAEVPPYYAYFSLLGSTVWAIAGSATLMTALVARKLLGCRLSDESSYRLILLGGILTTFMALDDILLFHDELAEIIRMPELLFHAFYLGYILSMIIYSRKVILSTPWLLLFAALAGYGLSSVIDLWRTSPEIVDQSEDVFKICGIILWAYYFLAVSWSFVREHEVEKSA